MANGGVISPGKERSITFDGMHGIIIAFGGASGRAPVMKHVSEDSDGWNIGKGTLSIEV